MNRIARHPKGETLEEKTQRVLEKARRLLEGGRPHMTVVIYDGRPKPSGFDLRKLNAYKDEEKTELLKNY
jgi:hypothetical protein